MQSNTKLKSKLQHEVLTPKPRDLLKVLLGSTFNKSLVVHLLGNCCKKIQKNKSLKMGN
jgi:hypothetical protein